MRTSSTLVGLGLLALAATARAQEAAPPSTQTTETAPPASEASATSTPTPPPELATMAEAPQAKPRKLQVALSFLPMGMGKYIYSPTPGTSVSSDAAFAYGVGISVAYEVLPHLLVGVAPQDLLNVKAQGGSGVDEYDLLARLAYVFPVVEDVDVYAEILPGYSLIRSPAAPAGLVLAFGLGCAMEITERYFVNVGGGYQLGFQSWAAGANSYDTRTRYVRVAMGGGVKF